MATVEQVLINFQGKDNVSPGIGSINKSISSLEQQAKKAGLSLQQIGEARGFNNLHSNISQSTSRMGLLQSAASKVRSTLESFSNVAGLLGSVVSLYAINNLTQSAIESSKSWNRIWANTNLLGQENVGIQKQIKSQVYDTAQKWGVATSELKAGVDVIAAKYGDINKAMEYSNGLAATSLLMNTSAEEVATALFRAEEGNLRTLKNKVLTIDQYNRYAADGVLTQEEINSILKENELRAQGLTETEAAKLTRMNNAIDKIKITLGSMLAGPLTSIAGVVEGVANWFNGLDDTSKSVLGTVGLIGVGFVALAPFLAPALDIITKMGSGLLTVLDRIGLINKTPCKTTCTTTTTGTSGGMGTAAQAAIGAGAVLALSYATFTIAQATITNETVQQATSEYGPNTGSVMSFWQNTDFLGGFGHVLSGLFTGGSQAEKAAEKEKMTALSLKREQNLHDWGALNRVFDDMAAFKLPSGDEILRDIDKKIPGLSWAIPTAQGIIDMVMNPKTPTVPWAIPGVDQVIQWVLGPKVPTLTWPTWGDIYNGLMGIFQSKISSINISGTISSSISNGSVNPVSAGAGLASNILGIGKSLGIGSIFSPLTIKPFSHFNIPFGKSEMIFPQLDPDNFVALANHAVNGTRANVMYVTVDARNMNPGELQQKMIELNEQVS